MGKSTINGPFSIAMLNYQRVKTHPFSSSDFSPRYHAGSSQERGPVAAREANGTAQAR